jgi:hypothetical protein
MVVIFEFIGEIVGQIFVETIFYSIPVRIYEWITGKDTGLNGYRAEQKKYIKFSVAKKFLLTWETDIEHLKYKMTDGLETMNEKLKVTDFQFKTLDQKTIIQPPTSISFYSFHFLVQWLTEYKINTVGVVEAVQTVYTTYNDPNSENLIGQTSKGKKFFISLMEDYSKRQFLRINRDIKTIDDYDVLAIKSGLAHSR